MTTRVLTRKAVEAIVTMPLVVDAVEGAFAAFGRGEAVMPPKVYLTLEDGDFRAMPVALGGSAGIKWVNVHPGNREAGRLPSVMGTFILSAPDTGFPLAVMDATWLTALRTGAAAAVASKALAGQPPETIGFIGAGIQGRTLHDAHRVVFPSFEPLVHDRDPSAAEELANAVGGRAVSLAEASAANIVCTATPSTTPFLRLDAVLKNAHINAMGADAPGKQELETSLLRAARVYVDDMHQATSSGEVNVPLAEGLFSESEIAGTLGEVLAQKTAPPSADELTVFDSTGLAVQDLALATAIYDEACARGLGLEVDLVGASPD